MEIFSVLLLVCTVGEPCTSDTAKVRLWGVFANVESKTPCEDWLLSQLEFNSHMVADVKNMTLHFECKLK